MAFSDKFLVKWQPFIRNLSLLSRLSSCHFLFSHKNHSCCGQSNKHHSCPTDIERPFYTKQVHTNSEQGDKNRKKQCDKGIIFQAQLNRELGLYNHFGEIFSFFKTRFNNVLNIFFRNIIHCLGFTNYFIHTII